MTGQSTNSRSELQPGNRPPHRRSCRASKLPFTTRHRQKLAHRRRRPWRLRRHPDAHGSQRARAVCGTSAEGGRFADRRAAESLSDCVAHLPPGSRRRSSRRWRRSFGMRSRIRTRIRRGRGERILRRAGHADDLSPHSADRPVAQSLSLHGSSDGDDRRHVSVPVATAFHSAARIGANSAEMTLIQTTWPSDRRPDRVSGAV